ncbi:MAG: hypothetical protein Q4F13_03960 [Pseudomonadota bacterium]|nr:hypothetical protein [Pseudomonadota bacterium]
MKKTALTLLVVAVLATGCAGTPGTNTASAAEGFGNQRSMHIDGKPMQVAETSARLLGDAQAKAPYLVEDITDGQGARKVPGYKLMLMNRTYSLSAEARAPRPNAPNPRWGNDMHMHRGVKLVVGIPVVDGRMDLAGARLLSMATVSDADAPADFKPADKIRPRGKQLVQKESVIAQPQLRISELRFPNLQSGESAGGGVKFEAEAVVDGKRVQTSANSSFRHFEVARAQAERAFQADARFLK